MRPADAVMTGRRHEIDFEQAPLLLIWETTQACALACRHCRADARPYRNAAELTTDEGKRLLDDTKRMGTPVVVLSGGDPMNRPDIYELIEHGASIGLRMCTIPAATSDLTPAHFTRLADAGLAKVAFSIDASTASVHDDIRRIRGTFDRSIRAAKWAREAGLSLQINSLACTLNIDDLASLGALVEHLGADMWELMFLIPTGRGSMLPPFTPEECERAFEIIYEIEQHAPFVVKVTEAPHYRRFLVEHGHDPERMHRVNAGRGFVFVSHVGEAFPSGFLPMPVGNVRTESIIDIYRNSPRLRALRDGDNIRGSCGECAYRTICGGSRSRAHAVTGDAFASEPWCIRV